MQEKTREALEASGIDVRSLSQNAEGLEKNFSGYAQQATPTVNKIINFLTTSSPETLGKVGLAAVAIYYLTPVAFKLLFSSLRGYAGARQRSHLGLRGTPRDGSRA